jgi:hypothetical protein
MKHHIVAILALATSTAALPSALVMARPATSDDTCQGCEYVFDSATSSETQRTLRMPIPNSNPPIITQYTIQIQLTPRPSTYDEECATGTCSEAECSMSVDVSVTGDGTVPANMAGCTLQFRSGGTVIGSFLMDDIDGQSPPSVTTTLSHKCNLDPNSPADLRGMTHGLSITIGSGCPGLEWVTSGPTGSVTFDCESCIPKAS